MITRRHWVTLDVVSALTQAAIRVPDLSREATNTVGQGAHRSECLLNLLHSVLSDESKSKFYPE